MNQLPRSIPVEANTSKGFLDNDRFAIDLSARLQQALGAAERERLLATKPVVAYTEWGQNAAARAGGVVRDARW